MDRNRLKGIEGDRFNAILSAAGMNFAKLLSWLADFLRLILTRLFDCKIASWAAYLDRYTALKQGFSISTN